MSRGNKKQLGSILVRQKLVAPEDLERELINLRKNPGSRLASTLVQSGRVAEGDMLRALSEQHGLPAIDLSQVVIPLADLKLIPADIAKQHLILPVLVREDRIFLAMSDPSERRVIDEIEFVTGRRVFPYVALHDALRAIIEHTYKLADAGQHYYIGPRVPQSYLESIGLAEANLGSDGPPASKGAALSDPKPGAAAAVTTSEPPPAASDDDFNLNAAFREMGEESPAALAAFAAPVSEAPVLDSAFESIQPPAFASTLGGKSPGKDRIVLVVDDDEDIRKLLQRVLTDRGYTVRAVENGQTALDLLQHEKFDLIVLDAMLPGVHGFEICKRIKGSKRYGHIPILMISAVYRGWRFAEDLRHSYGVEAVIEKPFKITEVIREVDRAVSEGSAAEGLTAAVGQDELSREAIRTLHKGTQAFQDGDLEGAIRILLGGIRVDPLAFKLHYHLGLLYGRQDNVFQAIHSLETAVGIQPRHFSALKNLAVLYQRAGFKFKAIEMWERALGSAPNEETKRSIKEHLVALL